MFKMAERKVMGNELRLYKRCSATNEVYALDIPLKDFHDWESGKLIQNAFPDLTAEQREFVKTGITPAEWKQMFGEEE